MAQNKPLNSISLVGAFVYLRLLRLYLPCHATLSCRNIPHPGTTPYTFIHSIHIPCTAIHVPPPVPPSQLPVSKMSPTATAVQIPLQTTRPALVSSHSLSLPQHCTPTVAPISTYRDTCSTHCCPIKSCCPGQPAHNANLPAHAQFGPRGTLAYDWYSPINVSSFYPRPLPVPRHERITAT